MGELSNRQVLKRCNHRLDAVLRAYQMLDPGERVIIGVSGGPDSLCLTHLLHEYNRRRDRNWRILAVHVDLGFPGWNSTRVVRILKRIGVECLILKADVPGKLKDYAQATCHVCAQERRRQLFDLAAELGIRKIAYAHHMEDVNETYLLNLLFSASASTFVPKQDFFGGKVQIVRPLYQFDKPLILRYDSIAGLRPIRNRCPQEMTGERMFIRRFLNRLYQRNSLTRTNLFSGIHNIKPDYLPGHK